MVYTESFNVILTVNMHVCHISIFIRVHWTKQHDSQTNILCMRKMFKTLIISSIIHIQNFIPKNLHCTPIKHQSFWVPYKVKSEFGIHLYILSPWFHSGKYENFQKVISAGLLDVYQRLPVSFICVNKNSRFYNRDIDL